MGIVTFLALCAMVCAQTDPPPVSKCVRNCEMCPNETLTYCNDPVAGIVNYTNCLAPADPTCLEADERAKNLSLRMQVYSDSQGCINAQKRLLCALLFPKCDENQGGAPDAQPVCLSTCENFFSACNVRLTDQCQYSSGVGPSATCTGLASTLMAPLALLMATLAIM